MIFSTLMKDDTLGFSSENHWFGLCLLVLVQLLLLETNSLSKVLWQELRLKMFPSQKGMGRDFSLISKK